MKDNYEPTPMQERQKLKKQISKNKKKLIREIKDDNLILYGDKMA